MSWATWQWRTAIYGGVDGNGYDGGYHGDDADDDDRVNDEMADAVNDEMVGEAPVQIRWRP